MNLRIGSNALREFVCIPSVESFTTLVGVQVFGAFTNFYSLFYTLTSTVTGMWFALSQLSWIVVVAGIGFCVLSCALTACLLKPIARWVFC